MTMNAEGLVAGPAMDAAVSAAVFYERWYKSPYCIINERRIDIETWFVDDKRWGPDDPPPGYYCGVKPPPYSRSMNAAWGVVEAMRARHYRVDILSFTRDEGWGVEFQPRDISKVRGYAQEQSVPLAICRAAIRALQGEAGA